jgi:hypothetical protein
MGTTPMSDQKIYRIAGICSLTAIAVFFNECPLYIVRGAFPSITEPSRLVEFAARNATNIITCLLLDLVILTLFLVFVAGFRHLIRQADVRLEWLATLFFGLALVYVTLTSRCCFRCAEADCLATPLILRLLLLFTGCDQAPLRGQQPKASGSAGEYLLICPALQPIEHFPSRTGHTSGTHDATKLGFYRGFRWVSWEGNAVPDFLNLFSGALEAIRQDFIGQFDCRLPSRVDVPLFSPSQPTGRTQSTKVLRLIGPLEGSADRESQRSHQHDTLGITTHLNTLQGYEQSASLIEARSTGQAEMQTQPSLRSIV